ncbi:MAG TPA: GNAT family N-acetyltransferase [Microbacterium sp.]|nr:GNAT family N-acetyltransferase [Microbacterium sp.]
MAPERILDSLETERLLLRRSRAGDAVVYRRLWTERDERVPPHRRLDVDGRPTVEDIASRLAAQSPETRLALLAVERKDAGDTIGYCGLIADGSGSADEPELAFELLRSTHGQGYATEAAEAVLGWAGHAGYRRLWAHVWDWNVASRRVLEKLGFREAGRVEPSSVHGHSLLTVRDL